ncbi:MAG: YdbL family protein [Desulfobacteraceae bacterium]|jgi:uncharacterized protein YdbL (DUF1318 family)
MRFKITSLVSLLVIGSIVLAAASWAQDLKSRMSARRPAINSLKASGAVGENNQGYLTLLKRQTDKKALVAAENKDRRKAYQIIAKQQGTTAEHVAKRRAIQIAKKAKPGTMLQNAKGKWYKK